MCEKVAEMELVQEEVAQPIHENAVPEPGEASCRRFAEAVPEDGRFRLSW